MQVNGPNLIFNFNPFNNSIRNHERDNKYERLIQIWLSNTGNKKSVFPQ